MHSDSSQTLDSETFAVHGITPQALNSFFVCCFRYEGETIVNSHAKLQSPIDAQDLCLKVFNNFFNCSPGSLDRLTFATLLRNLLKLQKDWSANSHPQQAPPSIKQTREAMKVFEQMHDMRVPESERCTGKLIHLIGNSLIEQSSKDLEQLREVYSFLTNPKCGYVLDSLAFNHVLEA